MSAIQARARRSIQQPERVWVRAGLHAGAEAEGVERADGEGAVATLRAAGAAGEPRTGAPSRIGQRRIHDLHEFVIARGKIHAAKNTDLVHAAESCFGP